MKVFITASSGIGKTAIVKELKDRGYNAYDVDDRELKITQLEIRQTGKPAEWPDGYVDWHHYAWRANEDRIKELLDSKDTVYVAGFVDNQEQLYPYFDKLIALSVNKQEHERRMRERTKREFGDNELNIQRRLNQNSMFIKKFIDSGFTIIDNSNSISITVDKIQEIVGKYK